MRPTIAILLSASAAVAQQTAWGQYYSQCLPGTATSTPSSSPTSPHSAALSSSSYRVSAVAPTSTTTTGPASTTLSSGTGGSTATGPGTTLQSGFYWIRAVESPNFHQYLQTSPEYVPGIAILQNYTTAGQFQIISGQLVELVGGGAYLYANVALPANSNVTMLPMSFETTQNTFGTFVFSGDAVEWSVASIDRPNDAAWLVCANQQLFINLGAYDYLTPAGCSDETIHYYNGATAVDKRAK